jgi:hypothetical protein
MQARTNSIVKSINLIFAPHSLGNRKGALKYKCDPEKLQISSTWASGLNWAPRASIEANTGPEAMNGPRRR